MRSLACIEAAHNPAAAGPRVQIPLPQPNSRGEGSCCGGRYSQRQFLCEETLATADRAGQHSRSALPRKKIQRSSVVERSAVNGKRAYLTCIRNALYIGKSQIAFDPIYQCQYQIEYQIAGSWVEQSVRSRLLVIGDRPARAQDCSGSPDESRE